MGRRGGVILVVDDDPVLRTLMHEVLSEEGYRVATAATFPEAVEALAHARFDLVLADALLAGAATPTGDWWGVMERLKILAGHAPVAIVTAASPGAFADHAERGFADVIAKPFDLDELLALVRRHLGLADT